jgi:hypothetical protein
MSTSLAVDISAEEEARVIVEVVSPPTTWVEVAAA